MKRASESEYPIDPSQVLGPGEKWTIRVQFRILLYFSCCFMGLCLLPNQIWSQDASDFVYVIGILGVWRYTWWMTHLFRAVIYNRITFPRLRARANEVWDCGWRPRRVHFQMTTYREARQTAEAVVRSICSEVREAGIPATIWIGSSEPEDERTLINHFKLVGDEMGIDLELRIIRQNQPGKRVAIALILRAMSRAGLGHDDLVVFMDGDFVLDKGCLTLCLPLFATDPTLHALTTDEDVIVKGPGWMQSWLSMRFSQRRMAMMSHALSRRVSDSDRSLLGVPRDAHHVGRVHPSAGGRLPGPLAVGQVPLPVGRRQEHLVHAAEASGLDALRSGCARLYDRDYRGIGQDSHGRESPPLVGQHAA